jgi:hypothetical protein
MVDKSRQANCTHCVTLDCTPSTVTRNGTVIIHEILIEGIHLRDRLEFCVVTVDSILNESSE